MWGVSLSDLVVSVFFSICVLMALRLMSIICSFSIFYTFFTLLLLSFGVTGLIFSSVFIFSILFFVSIIWLICLYAFFALHKYEMHVVCWTSCQTICAITASIIDDNSTILRMEWSSFSSYHFFCLKLILMVPIWNIQQCDHSVYRQKDLWNDSYLNPFVSTNDVIAALLNMHFCTEETRTHLLSSTISKFILQVGKLNKQKKEYELQYKWT